MARDYYGFIIVVLKVDGADIARAVYGPLRMYTGPYTGTGSR